MDPDDDHYQLRYRHARYQRWIELEKLRLTFCQPAVALTLSFVASFFLVAILRHVQSTALSGGVDPGRRAESAVMRHLQARQFKLRHEE